MKRTINVLGWAMLVSLALSVVLVAAVAAMAGSIDTAMVQIDGEPMNLAQLDAG